MSNVFLFNRKRVFTIEEAEQLLPIIFRLTDEAAKEVRYQMNRLKAISNPDSEIAQLIETEINQIVQVWQTKIEKLGARPKGMWLADFDNGEGFFCWKFPETKINHWHGYQDGFSARIMIRKEDESLI